MEIAGELGYEKRANPFRCYDKVWDPGFSMDRNFKEDGSYLEIKRGIDADGDDFGIFLQDAEDSVPSCKVEEVEEFCQEAHLDHLKSGTGAAGQRRAAWLDDRSCPSLTRGRCVRKYHNPLSATGLYRLLKKPRFGNADIPDADRRLIYIANLDPHYILALAHTASYHQVLVLRDAVWKHVALQTSIRVKIPNRGYPIFQLELHLPYFALRKCLSPKDPRKAGNSHLPRKWTDLSFLKIQAPKSHDQKKYGIYEAQISLVICGSDNSRWVAYAFVDTGFDEEDSGDDVLPSEGIYEDPIASHGELDANLPIGNPREYFLMIFEIRITQIRKEWESLIRTVERSIKRYRDSHSSTLSQRSEAAAGQVEDVKESFDWTLQTRELLSQLLDVLSETTKAWERFNSYNGDIDYFSDIDSSLDISQRARLSLRAIKETFETLEGLQQKLHLLEKSCHNSAQALQLRLTLEGNEAAQHNGINTELTVTIISPFALATAYFSMPQAVIPFNLNPQSFIISTLVIMAVVKLLFVVVGALLRQSWWRIKITRLMKTIHLDGIIPRLWAAEDGKKLALRRNRTFPDVTANDVEMNTFRT